MLEPALSKIRAAYFPGKRRLLSPWVPRSGVRRARIFGAEFELDLGDLIQREMYLGTFETLEARALAPLIPSGGVFVDVGANAGYFTALASRSVGPGGQVLAYEPSAQACDQLRAMVARNRMAQVEVIPVALTSRPGHVDLYVSSASGNHTPTLVPNAGGTATPVEARTLDTEFLRLGLSRIDVLKIDVEGYEGHVLAGASGLLAQGRIQYILCEFSPAWLAAAGTSCAELSERLESFGYERMRSTWLPSENPNRLYARSRALASSRACVHATASLPAPSSSF